MSGRTPKSIAAGLLAVAVLVLAPGAAVADDGPTGDALRRAFRPVVEGARHGVVEVWADGKRVALGTVANAEAGLAWVATKASEVPTGDVELKRPDGRLVPAVRVGSDDDADLAVFRAASEGLVAVSWRLGVGGAADEGEPEAAAADRAAGLKRGQWVVSAGPGLDAVGIGVVSTVERQVPRRRVYLGVGLDDPNGQPVVREVVSGMGAARAGMLPGDMITRVEGRAVADRAGLMALLDERRTGDSVTVTVARGEESIDLAVPLSPLMTRFDAMSRMGGPLSARANGFDVVIQHDTVLKPDQVGGPLVDIDGVVVGVNIARAGRIATYALPARVVVEVVDRLRGEAAIEDAEVGEQMRQQAAQRDEGAAPLRKAA